ncbi:MAG: threonylcarbamoyl-AMP synthase [Paracoccaceae bacterium]
MTRRLTPDQIDQAAALLRAGELVAFPTETVYGLGARADDDLAVAKVFEAKTRPRFNPLIVHVPSLERAQELAVFDACALRLAETFWPGPLTLVLPLREGARVSDLITAGNDTVAIRVPANPLALKLLQEVGVGVAAPSANISGQVSPTTADHVLEGLSGRIAAVLDGGPCTVGLESTIVMTEPPALLRPGGLDRAALETQLGQKLALPELNSDAPNAPGQLTSHYAPGAAVRLHAEGRLPDEVLLGFGDAQGADLNLSPAGDLREAAANLFAMLRRIDQIAAEQGATTIAVSPIPEHGLGQAINDRLRRAAAPRLQA